CSHPAAPTDAGEADAGVDAGPSYAQPYRLTPFANARINSQSSQPNFQRADAGVDFHDGPFSEVRLLVDLTSTCYPFDGWKNDPPPAGQNWPADCDAFDR